MDVISHALWAGIIFGRKTKALFFRAGFFGVLPDLLSVGIFSTLVFLGIYEGVPWREDPVLAAQSVPLWVYDLYNVSHSMFVWLVTTVLASLFLKRIVWEMGAGILHIVLDIFTHTREVFPTPFLWPLFDVRIDGISWVSPIIMIPNIILLALVYGWFYLYRKKNSAQ